MANMYDKALKFAFEAKEKRNRKMVRAGTYMSVLFPYDEFHFDFGRRTGKTTFINEMVRKNQGKHIVILVPDNFRLKSFDEVIDYASVYTVCNELNQIINFDHIDILMVDDASEIENLKELIGALSTKLDCESLVIKVG